MKHDEILTQAQELLRKGWARVDLARDANGNRVEPYSKDACAFCAVGALAKVLKENEQGHGFPYMDVGAFIGPNYIDELTDLNDEASNVDEVIACLEELKSDKRSEE